MLNLQHDIVVYNVYNSLWIFGVYFPCNHVVIFYGIFLGIRSAENNGHKTHNQSGKNNPRSGLLPVQQIPYAALGVALAEGQRRPGDDAPSGGKAQEGRGVIRPDFFAQLLHHRLVAAHLHVLGGENKRHPYQGIEPMDAQG